MTGLVPALLYNVLGPLRTGNLFGNQPFALIRSRRKSQIRLNQEKSSNSLNHMRTLGRLQAIFYDFLGKPV